MYGHALARKGEVRIEVTFDIRMQVGAAQTLFSPFRRSEQPFLRAVHKGVKHRIGGVMGDIPRRVRAHRAPAIARGGKQGGKGLVNILAVQALACVFFGVRRDAQEKEHVAALCARKVIGKGIDRAAHVFGQRR